LLQATSQRCTESMIHHEQDVRKEQRTICDANKQQLSDLVG